MPASLPDLTPWWPLPGREDLRRELEAAYADPSRAYHDLLHLTEVLQRIDELGGRSDTVLLAAWFHDAVYDGGPHAEERSAQWAERELPPELAGEVARLVRMTEHHRPDDADPSGCVLSDADLGILAAPTERYDEYVAAVRREYAFVDDASFRAGRAAILRDLVARPTLFKTAYAREHWEPAARANLERELARLTAT